MKHLFASLLLLIPTTRGDSFLGHQRRPYTVFTFRYSYGFMFVYMYAYTSAQTRPSGRSLHALGVCQLVGHRLVMPLLLRPQLVMHWLDIHALAKDSPGWPGNVSVTDHDLPLVHAIYMEDHRRQTMDSCKRLMVSVHIAICRLSAIESYMTRKKGTYLCNWTKSWRFATVLEGLFGESHSSSAALGSVQMSPSNHIVRDWSVPSVRVDV